MQGNRDRLDIKKDVAHIIQTEMEKLLSNPGLMHLIIKESPEVSKRSIILFVISCTSV
jgi:hypothetical protein